MFSKKIMTLTTIVMSLLPTITSSASVRSISSAGELMEIDGVRYTGVNVQCKSISAKREISQSVRLNSCKWN